MSEDSIPGNVRKMTEITEAVIVDLQETRKKEDATATDSRLYPFSPDYLFCYDLIVFQKQWPVLSRSFLLALFLL